MSSVVTTVRPRLAAITGIVCSIVLVVLTIMFWVFVGAAGRARLQLGEAIILHLIIAGIVFVMLAFAVTRVSWSHDGITYRNFVVTRHIAWSEIDRMRFAAGDPWAYVWVRGSGIEPERRFLLGLQAADASKSRQQFQELVAAWRESSEPAN